MTKRQGGIQGMFVKATKIGELRYINQYQVIFLQLVNDTQNKDI